MAEDAYPSRPIKLIVPYPAGSLVDLLGRSVGDTLSTSLKQPVVVDNKPGASTLLGADGRRRGAARWLHAASPDGDDARASRRSLSPSPASIR